MKPHSEAKRGIVAQWLRRADDDMNLAEYLLWERTAFPTAVAFHSQQAAEKYLKALLIWCDITFPKTHDLEELLDLVEPDDVDLAESLRDVIVLTPYGVKVRYPSNRPDATEEDAREAVGLAAKVREEVMKRLADAV
jgi:HEPN domain-containing protein